VRFARGVGAVALALGLLGCGGNSTDTNQSTGSSMGVGPCTSFDDRSAANADREIDFGGKGQSQPFTYAPACMEISAGQSVVFSGDFSVHPLTPGSAPGDPKFGSSDNPIPTVGSGNKDTTVKFPNSGIYPFYCAQHFAAGMVGVVQVD
jgi:plastocyanin